MNLLLIIILVFMIFKVMQGYKRGMVKEIIAFISLIILCVVILLIGTGLQSYMKKEIVNVVIAVVLLSILGIAHHFLSLIFFSAKMVVKLPVVRWLDKLLGMVVGVLETVLIVWTIYTFIMLSGMGMVGNLIREYTAESPILLWLYNNNLLFVWVEGLLEKIPFIQF